MFFDRQRTDYVREAVEKCKDYIRYTHYGAWNFSERENGEIVLDPAPNHGGKINYETFIQALAQQGYDGYLASEYCLPVLRNHKLCGIDEIDKATRRGLRYMKQLVQKASPQPRFASSATAHASGL